MTLSAPPRPTHWILALAAALVLAGCSSMTPPGGSATASGPQQRPLEDCLQASVGKVFTPGRTNDPIPTSARPAKGEAIQDPTYGACMARATDHESEPPVGFARNDYSRRNPFNADGSRFLVYAYDGYWHLYDGATLAWLARLPGLASDSEPNWHETDPNLLYWIPSFGIGMTINLLDVRNMRSKTVADMGRQLRQRWPKAEVAWSKSEGSPSRDRRYWALMVEAEGFLTQGIAVWDQQEQRLVGMLDTNERPDYVSMSPSGKHILVAWNHRIAVFDRELRNRRDLPARIEHADIALDAAGNDVYVAIDYRDPQGAIVMIDLDTGERTALEPTYIAGTATAMHFSGKAFDRPGWVLVSTFARGESAQQWLHEKIFALELKAQPRVVQLAHHRSTLGGEVRGWNYFRAPHAAVNRDFTRILFSSNWGVVDRLDVDAYMLALPPDALPR